VNCQGRSPRVRRGEAETLDKRHPACASCLIFCPLEGFTAFFQTGCGKRALEHRVFQSQRGRRRGKRSSQLGGYGPKVAPQILLLDHLAIPGGNRGEREKGKAGLLPIEVVPITVCIISLSWDSLSTLHAPTR
jgi:hypothetical protein